MIMQIMGNARLDGEDFETYKARRKAEKQWIKNHLRGKPVDQTELKNYLAKKDVAKTLGISKLDVANWALSE